MRCRFVYLSGPITGCSPAFFFDWRKHVARKLAAGISAIDPTRDAADTTLVSEKVLSDSERLANLLHGREILDRNRADLQRCDLLLVNLLGAPRVSIGSVGEIFWANAFGKPVIVVREENLSIHDHAILNAIATCVFHDLEKAIEKTNSMLADGPQE
jgi:nucleoside 2-deoxyribosyltransferase